MGNDLADLGGSGAAVDPLHQRGEPLGLRHPLRGPAFVTTAVIDELDVEPADRRRLPKHVGLQLASAIPSGLAARCGVEGKEQTPPRAGHDGRRSTESLAGTRQLHRAYRRAAKER